MSQETPTPAALETVETAVAENRTWFIVLGICLIILGIVAIAFPFMTTIAAKVLLGWLFLIGGFVQIVHSFATQKWSAFFLNLLIGLLYIVAGGWLAFYPLTGILTLTIMLAALFMVQGVMEMIMGFQLRPQTGWGWLIFSGLLALIVGIMIFAGLPGSAVWVLGLMVGINMITSGWAYLFLAMAADKKV